MSMCNMILDIILNWHPVVDKCFGYKFTNITKTYCKGYNLGWLVGLITNLNLIQINKQLI